MEAEANFFLPLAVSRWQPKMPMASAGSAERLPPDGNETETPAFMAGLAHDLKGMIAVILGYAELLEEENLADDIPLKKEITNKIMRSCSNMTDVINSCLDLSRLEHGQLKANRRVVDLTAFLEECAALQILPARKKSIKLVTRLEQLPAISVDPIHLNRIIGNLLGNAIKYSPGGSTVTLRAVAMDSSVLIEVSDQGPGIAKEEIPQLFELYRRGSARPTAGETSHGLGLAIVHRLTEANHGFIGVQSEPGKGSTFTVGFPLDPSQDLTATACA